MQSEDIAVKFKEHDQEIKSIKHRMDKCEQSQSSIEALAQSVAKLAVNMEHMLKEQEKQGEQIERLEQAPLDDYRQYKRTIMQCVITGIIGAVVGAVLALIL